MLQQERKQISANFSCEAIGSPRPVITWLKDNRTVPKNRIKKIEELSVLTVDSVEPQDQGRYWCEANSDEGWNRSTVANLTGEFIIKSFSTYHLRFRSLAAIAAFFNLIEQMLTEFAGFRAKCSYMINNYESGAIQNYTERTSNSNRKSYRYFFCPHQWEMYNNLRGFPSWQQLSGNRYFQFILKTSSRKKERMSFLNVKQLAPRVLRLLG